MKTPRLRWLYTLPSLHLAFLNWTSSYAAAAWEDPYHLPAHVDRKFGSLLLLTDIDPHWGGATQFPPKTYTCGCDNFSSLAHSTWRSSRGLNIDTNTPRAGSARRSRRVESSIYCLRRPSLRPSRCCSKIYLLPDLLHTTRQHNPKAFTTTPHSAVVSSRWSHASLVPGLDKDLWKKCIQIRNQQEICGGQNTKVSKTSLAHNPRTASQPSPLPRNGLF